MALVLADRVRETTTTAGTGTLTLSGAAPTGYQTFQQGIGNANTTYYTINANNDWEVGIGTYSTTGPTLTRDTVLASSAGGAKVDFPAGTKDVFVTYPAEKAITDGYGLLPAANGGTGQSSYTTGDLVYASDATTLSKLADVATGNALLSGGVGAAPAYGKVGLTTHVSGTLGVGNGGTGTATQFTAGSVVFAGASGVYSQDNANLFWDNTNDRLGIGTSSPGVVLDVAKTQAATTAVRITNTDTAYDSSFVATDTAGTGAFGYAGSTNDGYQGIIPSGAYMYATGSNGITLTTWHASAFVRFCTNFGSERMRIDSAGNVGIGTSSPGSELTVAGTIETVSGGVFRASRTDSTSEGGQIEFGRATDNATAWTLDVVGTTSTPDIRFYNAAGTVSLLMSGADATLSSLPTYNNTAAGSTVIVTSTGAICRTSSSIKYKKDIEDLDVALATNTINNLRPVWYRTKNPEGDDRATWSHIGLIAEEVHEVEPRLVRYRTAEVIQEQKPVLDEAGDPVLDEEGNPTFTTERVERELAIPEPEDVDYARLSVLLLAEVKELRARVAALEAA